MQAFPINIPSIISIIIFLQVLEHAVSYLNPFESDRLYLLFKGVKTEYLVERVCNSKIEFLGQNCEHFVNYVLEAAFEANFQFLNVLVRGELSREVGEEAEVARFGCYFVFNGYYLAHKEIPRAYNMFMYALLLEPLPVYLGELFETDVCLKSPHEHLHQPVHLIFELPHLPPVLNEGNRVVDVRQCQFVEQLAHLAHRPVTLSMD